MSERLSRGEAGHWSVSHQTQTELFSANRQTSNTIRIQSLREYSPCLQLVTGSERDIM